MAIGVDNLIDLPINACKNMAELCAKAILTVWNMSSPSKVAIAIGENVSKSIAIGVKNLTDKAINACKDMSKKCINTINNIIGYNALYEISSQALRGLTQGVSDGTNGVVHAFTQMANAAVAAANKALQIRSPSRIFKSMAENVTGTFAETVSSSKGF